jgi:hypothetical protein
MFRISTGPNEDARQVGFNSRSFVQRPPRQSPGDSQKRHFLWLLSLGLAKKVTRLPAGTGEVKVLKFILVRIKLKTGGTLPASLPTFCPSQQKTGKK